MRSRRLLFPAIAIVSAIAAFACNALVGLDKFDKVDCGTGQCAADVLVLGDVDFNDSQAPPPDSSLGDVVSKPAKWAHWVMPNPVYDAGLVVDADLHFEQLSGAGVVTEARTALIWDIGELDTTATAMTEQGAENYCAKLTTSGQKWRVPTRIELVTLLDFTQSSNQPALGSFFKVIGNRAVWSSSPSRTQADKWWTVTFAPRVDMVSTAPATVTLCVTGGS